ncbi:MAG: hypothetical protein M3Z09_09955 [Acidobacteriota bacterium]|nr:hypothetical protein [Acidobacteriota bacterium]
MKPAASVILLAAASCLFAIEKTDPEASILTMKRVYVDHFGGGETAAQIRDMLISALQSSHVVQVTENEERSDVVLRGSGEDLVFTEDHSATDNLNIHTNSSNSGTSSKGYASTGISAGENESNHSSERKHEASAAVRLVNRSGDVIWSATRESQGGKFRGASADVAEKLVKQLVQDVERLKASAAKQAGKPVL